MEEDNCPNCDVELQTESISDAQAGYILISCSVLYCPECLYIEEELVKISK